MPEVCKELGQFQVNLSQGELAYVSPKIATDIFSSIAYLEDMTTHKMAKKALVNPVTMYKYCDHNKNQSPNFNKALHMLNQLGYALYLKKIPDKT